MKERVSIVIPVYNSGEFLEETMESVRKQSYSEIELIIVNNCSTDPFTLDLLNSLRKQYTVVDSEQKGLSAARNDGIRMAQGKYILPLDSDDLIHPSFVEKSIALFQAKPTLTLVRTQVELFGKKKGNLYFEPYSFSILLARNMMVATSMFKKEDWLRVGGYDTKLHRCFEDWEFWINLLKEGGEVGTIEEPLFKYRIRKRSMIRSLRWDDLREARKIIWNKHKQLYGQYFVNQYQSLS